MKCSIQLGREVKFGDNPNKCMKCNSGIRFSSITFSPFANAIRLKFLLVRWVWVWRKKPSSMNWPIWCARSFVTSRRWCKYVFFSLQNPLISCFFQFRVSQRVTHRVVDDESESEYEESEEEGNTTSVSLYVFSQLRTNGHLFLGERQKTRWIDYLPHEQQHTRAPPWPPHAPNCGSNGGGGYLNVVHICTC